MNEDRISRQTMDETTEVPIRKRSTEHFHLVLGHAKDRCLRGKGAERHGRGGDLSDDTVWHVLELLRVPGDQVSLMPEQVAFPLGQAIKDIAEAWRTGRPVLLEDAIVWLSFALMEVDDLPEEIPSHVLRKFS